MTSHMCLFYVFTFLCLRQNVLHNLLQKFLKAFNSNTAHHWHNNSQFFDIEIDQKLAYNLIIIFWLFKYFCELLLWEIDAAAVEIIVALQITKDPSLCIDEQITIHVIQFVVHQ